MPVSTVGKTARASHRVRKEEGGRVYGIRSSTFDVLSLRCLADTHIYAKEVVEDLSLEMRMGFKLDIKFFN